MTDWKEHTGGPQPIADDVWVEAYDAFFDAEYADSAAGADWKYVRRFRILNQHLIDAAWKEALERGIRLGLEAAAKEVDRLSDVYPEGSFQMAAYDYASDRIINFLDPATIAREATLDTLTAEAQANNMGYDQHDTKRLPAALIGHQEPTND